MRYMDIDTYYYMLFLLFDNNKIVILNNIMTIFEIYKILNEGDGIHLIKI